MKRFPIPITTTEVYIDISSLDFIDLILLNHTMVEEVNVEPLITRESAYAAFILCLDYAGSSYLIVFPWTSTRLATHELELDRTGSFKEFVGTIEEQYWIRIASMMIAEEQKEGSRNLQLLL